MRSLSLLEKNKNAWTTNWANDADEEIIEWNSCDWSYEKKIFKRVNTLWTYFNNLNIRNSGPIYYFMISLIQQNRRIYDI